MRAAIYPRVSSLAQEVEGSSLETQERACRDYCAGRGYTVVGVWTDVHTGADLRERKGLSALREAVRAGQVDVVVAHAIDRLTRNQNHLGVLIDEFDEHGVRYEFVTEDFEQSAVGQFMRSAKAYAAEVEREKIRERSMRGKNERLNQGHLPTWTCDLYGYRNVRIRKKDDPTSQDKSRRELREDEAGVVRFIFTSVVEGVSLHEICRQLNERGVPSPGVTRMTYRDGKTPRWHASSIQHMVTNPAYMGMSVASRFTRVKFRNPDTGKVNKHRQHEKPQSEWRILADDLTPAIVDERVWELANERLQRNRGVYNRNQRRPYLLRGLIHCAHCGSAMYSEVEGGKNQRRMYRCSDGKKGLCDARTRVLAEEVEAWVWRQTASILRDREGVVAELRRLSGGRRDLPAGQERGLLIAKLADMDEGQSRLMRRQGSTPWELIERIEAEKAELRSRLAVLDEQVAAREREVIRIDEVADLIDTLTLGDADAASFEERARTIRDLGIELRAGKRAWLLDWYLPASGAVEDGSRWRFDFTGIEEPQDEAEREAILWQDWIVAMQSEAWERDDPAGFLAAQPAVVRRRNEAARYGAAYRPR